MTLSTKTVIAHAFVVHMQHLLCQHTKHVISTGPLAGWTRPQAIAELRNLLNQDLKNLWQEMENDIYCANDSWTLVNLKRAFRNSSEIYRTALYQSQIDLINFAATGANTLSRLAKAFPKNPCWT